jgi:hypothetical protein
MQTVQGRKQSDLSKTRQAKAGVAGFVEALKNLRHTIKSSFDM